MPAPRHFELAESGRAAALRGDHRAALGHYRDAIRLAVSVGAPEVCFRHYLEATLESLERMEAYDDVLEYCDRAIRHYADRPPQHDLARLDLASVYQRRGVILLKRGKPVPAREAFAEAVRCADSIGASLELARLMLKWLTRGLVVTYDRLEAEQKRLRYFSIRADSVETPQRTSPAPPSHVNDSEL